MPKRHSAARAADASGPAASPHLDRSLQPCQRRARHRDSNTCTCAQLPPKRVGTGTFRPTAHKGHHLRTPLSANQVERISRDAAMVAGLSGSHARSQASVAVLRGGGTLGHLLHLLLEFPRALLGLHM